MTTVLLCPELFARESGIQRILRLYLKALCDEAGPADEVRLVVLNDREIPPARLGAYANGRLTQAAGCGGGKAAFVRQTLRATRGAERIVCGHLGQLPVAWLARRFHPRVRYFLVAHGIEVWKDYSWPERIALGAAQAIICVSDYTRNDMQRRLRLPDGRLMVVPNALDPFFTPAAADRERAPGGPVILSVARLDATESYKGVDHLIDALPAVLESVPGARLRVVGSGSDLARLRVHAADRGVAEAVEFCGKVDDTVLRDAYATCRLFALPSRGEGFGIVYLEAMAHGKPCLGARAGAAPEIIDPASGVLVDYGDVADIARRLVWALQHPWDSRQIRARAMEFSYPVFQTRLTRALAA